MKSPQSEILRYLHGCERSLSCSSHHPRYINNFCQQVLNDVSLLLFLLLKLAVTRTWAARATKLCYNLLPRR